MIKLDGVTVGGQEMIEPEELYECEIKKQFVDLVTKEKYWEWRSTAVTDAIDNDLQARCKECHGKVRLIRKKLAHGPAPHARHVSSEDSLHCRIGIKFRLRKKLDTEHRESQNPVL